MKIDKLDHLSYSGINTFCECARCWYLRYVLGYDLPTSEAMSLGSEVHKAIEDYHREGKIPPQSYLSTFVEVYSEMYKPEEFDYVEELWEVPIVHYEDYLKPESERRYLMNNGVLLPLQAKMDRIVNDEIHDVKTSASKYKQEQIEGARQTSLYSYVFREKFKRKEKGVFYDVLIKNKIPKLQPMSTQTNDLDIQEALKWIWDSWQKIIEMPIPECHSYYCRNSSFLP